MSKSCWIITQYQGCEPFIKKCKWNVNPHSFTLISVTPSDSQAGSQEQEFFFLIFKDSFHLKQGVHWVMGIMGIVGNWANSLGKSWDSFLFWKAMGNYGIFISCILENSIWLLLNSLLEVFVAESIMLTLLTHKG